MTDRDRLIEIHTKAHNEWLQKEYNHETDKNLAEYCTDYLLANGVILPPCKVGDVVYLIGGGEIDEITIKEISYTKSTMILVAKDRVFGKTDIGKTVFLTKEDAEEKLKELGKNGI